MVHCTVITVELIAAHMVCDLCGAAARIPHRHSDPVERALHAGADALGAWVNSHRAPRLVAAEARVNGRPQLRTAVTQWP